MQLSGSTSIIRLFTKPHWNLKILRSLLIEPTTISHAIYDKYNENYADYECTTQGYNVYLHFNIFFLLLLALFRLYHFLISILLSRDLLGTGFLLRILLPQA